MKYYLDDRCTLCGYKNLPFALYDAMRDETRFMRKKEFMFLFSCNGKKDVDLSSQSEEVREQAAALMRDGLLREARNGETRVLVYHEYPGVFKENIQWSITGRCNYRCRHCFQSAPKGVLGEPTREQISDIIRQLRENGIHTVGLTGGEPLIRPDFFDILDELIQNGMHVSTIYSNGALITESWLDRLEERGIRPTFQISFDGVGCHDWMRGVQGAETGARNAIRLLNARGYGVSSAMCLCRENAGSIRETVLAMAADGCRGLKFQRAMPQGEWLDQEEHFLTVRETLQIYLDYLPVFKEDGCPLSIQMEGFFAWRKGSGFSVICDKGLDAEKAAHICPCGVVNRSMYVGPNGAVTPCMSMCGAEIEKQFPNIFSMPLSEILTDSSYTELTGKRINAILDHVEECRDCEYRYRCCGGCRAMATGQNGADYFGRDPVTCEVFRGGWADRLRYLATEIFGEENRMKETEKEDCETF